MEALSKFLAELEDRDTKAGTRQNYRIAIEAFFRWFDGHASRVTPLDMRQYRDLIKDRYAASTLNRKLGYLKTFFGWCHDRGITAGNVAEHVRGVAVVELAPRWLERSEVYRLLRHAQESAQLESLKANEFSHRVALRNFTIITLILNTGLRASELCDLEKRDVTLRSRSGELVVREGKRSTQRKIPLNADARAALKDWLKHRPNSGPDYVFVTDSGQMTRQLVQYHVSKIAISAGLNDCSPHTLRHTFAKTLVDQGVSLDRVAKMMGHASVDTTKIYTAPSLADLRNDVDRISVR